MSESDDVAVVEETEAWMDRLSSLYLDGTFADVFLDVDGDGDPLPAHRVILASSSDYFRNELSKTTTLSRAEMTIMAPRDAFIALLKYIYTGKLSMSNESRDVLVGLIGCAEKFGFQDLAKKIEGYLQDKINMTSVFEMLQVAEYDSSINVCLAFAERHFKDFLASPDFVKLPISVVHIVLEREIVESHALEVFDAVDWWLKVNTNVSGDLAAQLIRTATRIVKQMRAEIEEARLRADALSTAEGSKRCSNDSFTESAKLVSMKEQEKLASGEGEPTKKRARTDEEKTQEDDQSGGNTISTGANNNNSVAVSDAVDRVWSPALAWPSRGAPLWPTTGFFEERPKTLFTPAPPSLNSQSAASNPSLFDYCNSTPTSSPSLIRPLAIPPAFSGPPFAVMPEPIVTPFVFLASTPFVPPSKPSETSAGTKPETSASYETAMWGSFRSSRPA